MSRIEKLIIIVALTTILGATIITGYVIYKQESEVYKVKYKTFPNLLIRKCISILEFWYISKTATNKLFEVLNKRKRDK